MNAIKNELKQISDFMNAENARAVAIDFYVNEIRLSREDAIKNIDQFGVEIEQVDHQVWAENRALKSGMPVSMLQFFDAGKYLEKFRNSCSIALHSYKGQEYVITDFVPF